MGVDAHITVKFATKPKNSNNNLLRHLDIHFSEESNEYVSWEYPGRYYSELYPRGNFLAIGRSIGKIAAVFQKIEIRYAGDDTYKSEVIYKNGSFTDRYWELMNYYMKNDYERDVEFWGDSDEDQL